MINEIIKLTGPKKLEVFFEEENLSVDDVVVRPRYLSICAADQRYYQGWRKKEILDKKLPLALMHEATGEVIYDPKNIFKKGDKVVMIPNTPIDEDEIIKENYRTKSLFRSSSIDGFMQAVIFMRRDRLLLLKNIKEDVGVLSELVSVSINAIDIFDKKSHSRKDLIGVWGCGNVGYVTSLMLKLKYPDSKIVVIGTTKEKLSYFSFADETKLVSEIDKNFKVDHAFECVGDKKSQDAIGQIIECINPQGTISLLGVSEEPVPINTRTILEKGLQLIGNSRSGYSDFEKAVELLENNRVQEYLNNIISEIVEVNEISNIHTAFEHDLNNDFKTIMKWNM